MSCRSSLYILEIITCIFWKYFLQFNRLLICAVVFFFCCAKAFWFDVFYFCHSDRKWNCIVTFICISLMTNVEYLFMCLFAVCISFLTRYLFKSFAHLLAGWFLYFCITEFWQFFLHPGYSPLSVAYFADVCCPSVACLLVPLTVSCMRQKHLLWWSLLDHCFFYGLCV